MRSVRRRGAPSVLAEKYDQSPAEQSSSQVAPHGAKRIGPYVLRSARGAPKARGDLGRRGPARLDPYFSARTLERHTASRTVARAKRPKFMGQT